MNKRRDLVLAFVGLAILVFALNWVGMGNLLRQMSVLRIGLPVILTLSFARLIVQSVAWNLALRHEGIHSTLHELMLVRLASQGMGYLTVLGPAASEPMKISLLRSHARSATTATLVDTGVYWVASGLFGMAGCIAAGMVFAGRQDSTASMLLLGLFLCGVTILIVRSKSPVAQFTSALGARCPKWLAKAAKIDVGLRSFAAEHPGVIRKMFALDLVCQALVAGEVVAVLLCMHLTLNLTTVLGLEAATRMVKIFAGAMPARIGADESGAAAAFAAFGLPAASGLAMALARRSKDLLGCLIGLTWLASSQKSGELAAAPPPLLPEMGE